MSERLLSISSASRIMPLKGRNGNLPDKGFKNSFQEKEENREKNDNELVFRPSEIVEGDEKRQSLIEVPDQTSVKEDMVKTAFEPLQRRIDVVV